MLLRPHHLLDIITEYGAGTAFVPHPYGHAVHTCAEMVLNDLDPPRSKQEYNDALDRRVLAHLHLREGEPLTVREFLQVVCRHFAGLPKVCTHPGSRVAERETHLWAGLQRLGFHP
jgi:hypothetical protein